MEEEEEDTDVLEGESMHGTSSGDAMHMAIMNALTVDKAKVKMLGLITKNNSLELRIKALQKELQGYRVGAGKDKSDDDEEPEPDSIFDIVQQLQAKHQQEVQRLKDRLEERDLKITELELRVRELEDEKFVVYGTEDEPKPKTKKKDRDEIKFTLPEVEVENADRIDPDHPSYWGILVQDLCEFCEEIADDMNDYIDAHALLPEDGFKHICRNQPCRFPHYNVPYYSNSHWNTTGRKLNMVGNMHLVVERYMKPCLCGQLSYAAMLNRAKGRLPPKVTTFVSHSWMEPFQAFSKTLETALDPMEAVFVCSFAIDQHMDIKSKLDTQLCNSPFALALQRAPQILVVIDPQITVTQRLWCDFEIAMARKMRKPILMWPNIMTSKKLDEILEAIEKLDTSTASASDQDDKRRITKFIMEQGGGFDRLTTFLRELLKDRVKFFKQAIAQVRHEKDESKAPQGTSVDESEYKLLKDRLRQVQTRFEVEDAKKLSLADVIHGQYEFAEVTGPFFPTSDIVEQVYDSDLRCLVYRIRGRNGLTRLKCAAALELGFGTWQVGFSVKYVPPEQGCGLRKDYHFHDDIVLGVDGECVKQTKLSQEIPSNEQGWTLLVAGEVKVPLDGVGSIMGQSLEGYFQHPSFDRGRRTEITVNLQWSANKNELHKGTINFVDSQLDVSAHVDGQLMSVFVGQHKLEFRGKLSNIKYQEHAEDSEADMLFSGVVLKSNREGGSFEMKLREQPMKTIVEVAMASDQNNNTSTSWASCSLRSSSSRGFSGAASPLRSSSYGSLPALQAASASPASPSVRKRQETCSSKKKCLCQSKPHSHFGFFIDRCFASRVSEWAPRERTS